MADLKCISIPGMKLWFNSNDHNPPHFHAKRKGEWIFKIWFMQSEQELFELVWSAKKKQMSKADRDLLQKEVNEHRFEILTEWEQKVNRS